jgi:hypothetical protein
MEESYSYAPLLHEGQIRLFKLHISREDEPLVGSMVAVSPDQIPPYKALSYTWGTPYGPEELARLGLSSQTHQTYSIICDWRILPVTENLYDALVELRSQEETAFFWIDAICINQKDEDEKSLQVQMMGSIYSNAEIVIVWLGKRTPECDEAIKLLLAAAKLKDLIPVIRSYTEEQWLLIKTFCSRQWFARTWALQEAILAKNIVGLCGSTQFSFYQVITLPCVISNISRVADINNLVALPATEGSKFECIGMLGHWVSIGSEKGLSRISLNPIGPLTRQLSLSIHGVSEMKHIYALLDLLVSDMRQREVSDPKDRILAPMAVLLNWVYMFNTEDGESIKQLINYRHDVASLYQIYTVTSIRLTYNLDVLSQVGGNPCKPPLDLPSWVPDFRSKPMQSLLGGTFIQSSFNASNGLGEFEALSCAIRGKSRDLQTIHDKICFNLKLRGVLLGQVLHIQDSRKPSIRMWLLFGKHVMSWSPPYIDKDYLEVISRTLTADMYMGKCPASDDVQQLFVAFVMVETAMELEHYLSHAEDASLGAFWETQTEFLKFWEDYIQGQKIAILEGSETETSTAVQEKIEEICQTSDGKASSSHALPASWTQNISLSWRLMKDAILATEKFLFATDSGYLGLAPQGSKAGDAVWIVQGGKVPFILRSTGKGSFRFVGEAYVHGRMFGEIAEVAKAQNLPLQDILIDE